MIKSNARSTSRFFDVIKKWTFLFFFEAKFIIITSGIMRHFKALLLKVISVFLSLYIRLRDIMNFNIPAIVTFQIIAYILYFYVTLITEVIDIPNYFLFLVAAILYLCSYDFAVVVIVVITGILYFPYQRWKIMNHVEFLALNWNSSWWGDICSDVRKAIHLKQLPLFLVENISSRKA